MYTVTVCGIPAQAVVTDWNEGLYGGDAYPVEVDLYDRKGYRAKWLESKMSSTPGELDEVLHQIKNYNIDDPY